MAQGTENLKSAPTDGDAPAGKKSGGKKGGMGSTGWLLLAGLGVIVFFYIRSHTASAQNQQAMLNNALSNPNYSSNASGYNGPVTPYTIYTYGGGGGVGSSFFSGSGTLGTAGTGQIGNNGQPVFASSNDTINGNAYQNFLKNVNSAQVTGNSSSTA